MNLGRWRAPLIGLGLVAAAQAVPAVRYVERFAAGSAAVELSTRYHEMFLRADSARHFAEAAQEMEVDDAERYLEEHNNPWAKIHLAQAYEKAGEHGKSEELYTAVVAEYEAAPDNEELWWSAKAAYTGLQNHSKATELTLKIERKEAQEAMARGNYPTAISLYQAMGDQAKVDEATRLQEKKALREAATIANDEGRYDDAYHAYTQLGEGFQEQANEAAKNAAKKAIRMGDERGAREWWRKAGYDEGKIEDFIKRERDYEIRERESAQERAQREEKEAQEKKEAAFAAGGEAFDQEDYEAAIREWTVARNEQGVKRAHLALADQLWGEEDFPSAASHYLAAGDEAKVRDAFEKAAEGALAEGNPETAAYYYEKMGDMKRRNEALKNAADNALKYNDFATAKRCYTQIGMPFAEVEAIVIQGKRARAAQLQADFGDISGVLASGNDRRLREAAQDLEFLIQLKTELGDTQGVEELWRKIADLRIAFGSKGWAASALEQAGDLEGAARLHMEEAQGYMAPVEGDSTDCANALVAAQDAEELYPQINTTLWGAEFDAFERRAAVCVVREGMDGGWSYNSTDRALEILTAAGWNEQEAYQTMAVLSEDLGDHLNATAYYEKAGDHHNTARSWLRVYRARAMYCISETYENRPGIGECLSGASRNSELFVEIAEQLSAGD